MFVLLGTVFTASLLGSLHCVGMCGPFAILAGASEQERKSAFVPALAYSFGRLATYSIVGVLFGSMGLAINRGASLFGGVELESVQQTATLIAGALMVSIGLVALARTLGWRIALPRFSKRFQKGLQTGFQRVKSLPRIRRAFSIGALTCLMPCGWLYTFAVVAAGTGGPLAGMAVMVAFWAGTVPILAALMMGFGQLSQAMRRSLPTAMAVIVILIGCFTIAFRAPVAIGSDVKVVDEADLLVQQIKTIDHADLPCCSSE